MFSGKVPPSIADGSVLLYGQKYHFERVLYAYTELIDALTLRFGSDKSYAAAKGWPHLPNAVSWPEPGRHDVTQAWRGCARGCDVMNSCVVHRIGQFEAHAYVLGRDMAWYSPAKQRLHMPDRRLVTDYARAEPRSAPHIDIFGPSKGGEMFGISGAQSESLRAMLLARQAKYGLLYTTTSVTRGNEDIEIFARIGFPEEVYGAGEDWLQVRCVLESGAEVATLGPAQGSN